MPTCLEPGFWGCPDTPGYRLSRLTIVGPYPTAAFLQKLEDAGLHAATVCIVVDEGWDAEEIESIKRHVSKSSSKLELRYARSGGLVHAKLYLAEWYSKAANRTTRQLGWGSANASAAGFGSNAEAISFAPLPITGEAADQTAAVLAYFETFKELKGVASRLDVTLRGGVRLLLPTIAFNSDAIPETFEGWIQSGRLCHRFDPDQRFGKLSLQLGTALPNTLLAALGKYRLATERQTHVLNYPYAARRGNTDGETVPKWRGRYFVETWYGHWTSRECYEARRKSFKAKNRAERLALVERIRSATSATHTAWSNSYIDAVRGVRDVLKRQKYKVPEYLKVTAQGALNTEYYALSAIDQMEKQATRAGSKVFEERFADGYVFPPLPALRSAEVEDWSFDDFESAFCESLVAAMRRPKSHNLVAQRVRELLKEYASPGVATMTGEDLRDWLRSRWKTIGADVRAFHEDE